MWDETLPNVGDRDRRGSQWAGLRWRGLPTLLDAPAGRGVVTTQSVKGSERHRGSDAVVVRWLPLKRTCVPRGTTRHQEH